MTEIKIEDGRLQVLRDAIKADANNEIILVIVDDKDKIQFVWDVKE